MNLVKMIFREQQPSLGSSPSLEARVPAGVR